MGEMFQYITGMGEKKYYLFSTGTTLKPGYYPSRQDAINAMEKYCIKNGIKVECTEYDKHERKYSNHEGVRFYINRVLG